ncbi:UDP-N-acetylmuramoyl-L-alanyl-D-glutamate--2,6-diaminopimelate ligase [Paenibacillus lemnae]|uniref:UDP-N-acetylmuramyl-tripeptide synthetase n=1 Tax=Paenibacillus lemnae TaxID=1330551 RepID=A0A848M2S0_PAELE|nr:UDP-N-acetylmuramoyl-L-alanyl-D-glutamate--2,6-diaminopimelate ligase [Paenibacillus lemnae]NMO95207.1 UDP-N-acetylmuramoyl-L-alanyl-D-glutamate--2,6-diaminopimelate ligase [Paenibacillus lemnae]
MLLSSVLQDLSYHLMQGDPNAEVSAVAFDSREVVSGAIFVAISGFTVDGHQFISTAISLGASVIVVEKDIETPDLPVTVIRVEDTRDALARISSNFYGRPTEHLNMVGITGTNGKTSITYFIKSILDHAGKSAGIIGTIGTLIGGELRKNKNTTPEALYLQQIFAEMVEKNVETCVMEVSSHALSLKRVGYSRFHTGIFTNLTPDHLELHGSMEEYFEAKSQLFQLTSHYNIINADDPYGARLLDQVQSLTAKAVSYGMEQTADVYAADIRYRIDSTRFTAHTPAGSVELEVRLPGDIYVLNSLAALAWAYCSGIPLETAKEGIQAVEGIKGRMEVVYRDEHNTVIVDFAHTEDSLEKVLHTLRPYTKGRIILVFGVYAAPGELGLDKRRSMGQVAARHADLSVITSDNPKDQDPDAIISDIAASMKEHNGAFKTIVDRKEAIEYALTAAQKDDIVLITGKGHETTQIIGNTEIPFHEGEIVRNFKKRQLLNHGK